MILISLVSLAYNEYTYTLMNFNFEENKSEVVEKMLEIN